MNENRPSNSDSPKNSDGFLTAESGALAGDLSREILWAILRCSSDAIITIDSALNIIQFNECAERMFGYSEFEMLGNPIAPLLPPSARTPHESVIDPLDKTMWIAGVRSSGEAFPIDATITQHNIQGKPYYTAVIRDLAHLKLVETERVERQDTLQPIVDSAPFGALVFELKNSKDLVLIAANKSADRILARNHQGMIGRTFGQCFADLVGSGLEAELRRVALTGKILDKEVVSKLGNEELVLELHAFPMGPNRVGASFGNVSAISESLEDVLQGWSRAMDARDKEVEGHSKRTAAMSEAIGRAMGLSQAKLRDLRRGALVHDVGKIAVPDAILLKPGKLTPEEREIMERHSQDGYDMLKNNPFMRGALVVPRYHHEKWDGTGYPDRLKGEDIPLLARIFAVSDVWDAMCSVRPYRRAFLPSTVFEEIESQSGRHFDPQIVEALKRILILHEDDTYSLVEV